MRSPIRFFILCAIFGFLLGFLLDQVNNNILGSIDSFIAINLNNKSLDLAHSYLLTGRFDNAISEYKATIPALSQSDAELAQQELSKVIFFQSNTRGQLYTALFYWTWLLPPKLYLLSSIFILLAILIFFIRAVKRPTLVFLAFRDYAGLNINNLAQALTDRIREVVWRMESITTKANLIAENLDVPVMGMISEGVTFNAIAAIETAFVFSTGVSNLPLSNLLTSLFIWLEQPRYLVRGEIEKVNEELYVKVFLIDNLKQVVKKSWHSDLPASSSHSEVVNAIIYPLLFYFNNDLRAGNWEALKELHLGIEEYLIFREQNYSLGHLQKAQNHIERALEFDVGYEIAKYDLGLFLLSSGDYENARRWLSDVSTNSKEQRLKRFSSYNYGVALFELSQDWAYERAIKVFQGLLDDGVVSSKEEKDLNNLVRSALSNVYAKMALRDNKHRSNLIDQSITEADKVLKDKTALIDSRLSAMIAKGYAHLAEKKYSEAIASFTDALNQQEGNVTGWIGLGQVYLAQGSSNENALSAFQAAARLSPFGGYANYRLGNIYRELGDIDLATTYYMRAPRLGLARIALGKLYLNNGELLEALNEFRLAIKLNSHLSEGWVNVAWAIMEMDDKKLLPEAEKAARRAVQLEKNEDQLWHRYAILSKCLLFAGKYEASHQAALKAIGLGPDRPQAYYYLALAQHHLGLHKDFTNCIKKILALDTAKGDWYQRSMSIK